MNLRYLFACIILFTNACFSQETTSTKIFDQTALLNKIAFYNPKYDQPKFSCGFLLKYNNETFAVTAKHVLQIIKPDEMKTLSLGNFIKSWSLFPLDQPNEVVNTDALLNENKDESLSDKASLNEDWLLFSIKSNLSKTKVLEVRTTPLVQGEKLYVIGWTRKMETGKQRVYEFEYFKTLNNRILLKDIIVPEKFGGLSGAPLVDEQGYVVGIVSNGTVDPDSNKRYFSPCALDGLITFIKKYQGK